MAASEVFIHDENSSEFRKAGTVRVNIIKVYGGSAIKAPLILNLDRGECRKLRSGRLTPVNEERYPLVQ